VDTSELIPRLEKAAPKSVLEMKPFGRSGETSIWIEMRAIGKLAEALSSEEVGFDWLENMSVMEIEGALVFTYFLRSSLRGELLILRGSVMPRSQEAEVMVDSTLAIWPMALPFEQEISEMFGVSFKGGKKAAKGILPDDWHGYPLRKGYIFPAEYGGILHMRPVGQTEPDEFGATE
jgi:NADH:ubiquinone oxidoreductase subunit C